jgi:hypothetical protein
MMSSRPPDKSQSLPGSSRLQLTPGSRAILPASSRVVITGKRETNPSPRGAPGPPQRGDVQLWLWLLVLICLAGLGSLTLTPQPLVSSVAPQVQPALQGGECNSTPNDINYLSSGQDNTGAPPQMWSAAGLNAQQFAYAQACAAAFVTDYQTFDSANSRSLETATYMLTQGARERFYGQPPRISPDNHMNPLWRATVQRKQLKQIARVRKPILLQVRRTQGNILVWLIVPYQLSLYFGDQLIVDNDDYTVLLVAVPPHIQHRGTGWQVSAWSDGSTLFAPPDPL